MTRALSILERDRDAILAELGIHGLSEKEKQEVGVALLEHFEKVIIETVIVNLDDEELGKFKSALKSENLEEKVMAVTAGVPGLAGKIEEALAVEFEVIKSAREAMK